MPYYAVANGRIKGIFLNIIDCNKSVVGYKNAIYKEFETIIEADNFIQINIDNKKIKSLFLDNIDTKQNNEVDFIPDYYVYTDGACSNNGKSNAIAGIGIYFDINDSRNISKQIEGKQTNNTAELSAIIETYNIIENDINNGIKIAIVTDSRYSILCVSSYGEKCYKKDWNISIPNKELVKTAYELYKDKQNIKFIHIKAHTTNMDMHSIGNKNADKLANIAIGRL